MGLLISGEHPVPFGVILVKGSAADLGFPAVADLSAPVLEFAVSRGSSVAVTHSLVLESGEWVAHLSAAQVEALAAMKVARVRDGSRVLAAGEVDFNPGWDGKRSTAVMGQQASQSGQWVEVAPGIWGVT